MERVLFILALTATAIVVLRDKDRRKKILTRWQYISIGTVLLVGQISTWGDAMSLQGQRAFGFVFGTGVQYQGQSIGGPRLNQTMFPATTTTVETPTPVPQPTPDVPRLNAGTIWYAAPNINGTVGDKMEDISGQPFTIVGRAGNPPWPPTCYCFLVEVPELVGKGGMVVENVATGRGWVLAQSIPYDQAELTTRAIMTDDQTK